MRKVKFFLTILIFLSWTSCFAQNVKSVEGTTWRGIDNGRETEVVFLKDGIAQVSYHTGASLMSNKNSKWTQTGNKIYWEINNKFVEKNGEIRGDSFAGSAKNIKGLEWTFSYKLMPENAPLFNPSKELAMEQTKLMTQRQAAGTSSDPNKPVSTEMTYSRSDANLASPQQAKQDKNPDYKLIEKLDGMDSLYDVNSVAKSGNTVRALILLNWHKPQKFDTLDGVSSLLTLSQFSCSEKKRKDLEASLHSEKNASGKLLLKEKIDQPWVDISKNEGVMLTRNMLCK